MAKAEPQQPANIGLNFSDDEQESPHAPQQEFNIFDDSEIPQQPPAANPSDFATGLGDLNFNYEEE